MADQSNSSSSLLLSAFTGAALGAAGLTWWLLSRAERRMALSNQVKRLSSLTMGSVKPITAVIPVASESLEERVQRLNLAIDEVRRQLENLSPEETN